MSNIDLEWMKLAYEQALDAGDAGEVPVGAVVVLNGELIAKAYNMSIVLSDPSAHAEILALRAAGQKLGNYRLNGAELYVTLEPCAMCVGAMHHARIKRVITGANDPKTGCTHSLLPLLNEKVFFSKIELTTNIYSEECGQLLKDFFAKKR